MEPITPTAEVTFDQCHKPTPFKAKIQGTIDSFEQEGITGKEEAVFLANGVSHPIVYRILKLSSPRKLKKKKCYHTQRDSGSEEDHYAGAKQGDGEE